MADDHDDRYYREIGQDLHGFIRPLVVDVLVREVGPILEEPVARRIAREEIASLCGLVLRRLQEIDEKFGTPGRPNTALSSVLISTHDVASIFGEALRDFSSDTEEPGE